MRVGVTGAGGFIGSALVSTLAQRGDDIVTFVRPQSRPSPGLSVRWDPVHDQLDVGDLRRAGHLDAIVHLAGAGIGDRRWTTARRREILESRTASTRLLVHSLRELPEGAPFLASGSAVGYYGSRGDEILDEDSSPGDDFLARVCREWEREAASLRDSGSRVATLRTGIVASATGGALARQLGLFRHGLGGPLGAGTQWISPIALGDAVRAIMFVLDERVDGPVNLVAPCAVTNRDFTTAIARAVNRRALLRVPAAALRLALGRALTDGVVLASQRVAPKVLLESGFEFHAADIDALLRSALSPVS
ncbi:MAG TPA: TIGR01777 family oxidoreductase [Acidimicrobiales bacterium]|nr:TIGR01777 family oxidoreductase [Acidimicrobiales bacterium]